MKINRSIYTGLAGAMLSVCVNINLTYAETKLPGSTNEVLKNIKHATGSCTQQSIKPVEYVHVENVKADLTCVISAQDLAKELHKTSTVLVDTRSAAEFSSHHIDGAMNLAAPTIRNKAFLRDKSVVLVGNGKNERELYTECKRLKSTGFKQVRVLMGGMPAWVAAGQGIVGLAPNIGQPTRLSPAELWLESQFDANLILVSSSQAVLQKQLPNSVLLSDAAPKTIQKLIEQRHKQSKAGLTLAVVLVADKSIDVQSIGQAIKPVPFLYYTDSEDMLTKFIQQQKAVWESREKGPKQPQSCGR